MAKKTTEEFLVKRNITVKEAMRQMSRAGEKILFVIDDEERLMGSLSDGDIRRWVLKGGGLSSTITRIYNKKPVSVDESFSVKDVKHLMLDKKISWIPVLDSGRKVSKVLLWNTVFGNGSVLPAGKVDLPVVIMAGGKGTRLDPFTRILPKPLIPIGDKAIIQLIMDNFNKYGVKEFYVSVHHKSKMIKAYFEEMNTGYKIHYVEEIKPLGTAGSLRFLLGKIESDLFISNCDIIVESNYLDIVDFHKSKDYDITIVGSFRHFTIPYGICLIEHQGRLKSIQEKPEYDFLVNTGMYLIKKEILNLIPRGKVFNITDLVRKVMERGGTVGVFPIDEKSWIDVGQWEEYHKSLKSLAIT